MALTDIVSHATLKTGLLAYYKMEGNARDSWGTNNGTAEKAITATTGKLLNCISFDGNGEPYDNIGVCQVLNLGQVLASADSLSIAFWANTNSLTSTWPVLASLASWDDPIMHAQSRLAIQYADGSSGTAYLKYWGTTDVLYVTSTFATGTWIHWAFTVDYNSGTGITTITAYKNGSLAASTSGSIGGRIASTIPLTIGGLPKNYFGSNWRMQQVNGKIDEVAIANRAWTASEVSDFYNSGNGLPLERQPSILNHPTLKTGMVAGYPLENLLDVTSNHLDATAVGSPTNVTAKLRNGYKFNGTSQCLNLGASLSFAPTNFSVSFWSYIDGEGASSWQQLFSRALSWSENSFMLAYNHSATRAIIVCSSASLYMTKNLMGRWTHWVGIYSGGLIYLYIDAVSAGGPVGLGSLDKNPSYNTRIGARDPGAEWANAKIDDLYFWDRALTADEITDLYNDGIGMTWDSTYTSIVDHPSLRSSLLSLLPLDTNANDYIDSHPGTLVNNPAPVPGKLGNGYRLVKSSNQYISIPTHADFNTYSFTSSFWFYCDSIDTEYQYVVSRNDHAAGQPNWGYAYGPTGDPRSYFYVKSDGGNYLIYGDNVVVGQWRHVVIVVKLKTNGKQSIYLYENGVLKSSTEINNAVYWYPVPIILGRTASASVPYQFDGRIDEYVYWQRALEASEAFNLYNANSGLPWFVQPTDINTSETLKDGLIGYWTLDTNANDCVGTRHGTLNNSPTNLVCKLRKGYQFNGTDQSISIPHDAGLNLTKFTYAVWVCPGSTTDEYEGIFFKGGNGGIIGTDVSQPAISRVLSLNKYYVSMQTTGHQYNSVLGGDATAGVWAHVVATYDGTSLKIYHNGALANTGTPSGSQVFNTWGLFFGRRGGTVDTQHFSGKVDEGGIWNRALSAAEVAQLYNNGIGITWDGTFGSITDHPTLLSGLVSAYRLDKDGNDYLIDNHGNAQGTVAFGAGKIGDSFNPNGVGDYQIPVGTEFDTDYVSIVCWAKPTTLSNWDRLVAKATYNGGPVTDQHCWALSLHGGDSNKYCFSSVVGSTYLELTDPDAQETGVWKLLAGTYDGAYRRLWKNGVNIVTSPYLSGVMNKQANLPIFIGTRCADSSPPSYTTNPHTDERFQGYLDQVLIYNRALAPSEMVDLYNSGNGLPWYTVKVDLNTSTNLKDGLVGYWTLDTDASDSVGTRHGTLNGAPTNLICRLRKGYEFNGSGQSITVPHDSGLNLPVFTYALWVRPDSYSTWQAILQKGGFDGFTEEMAPRFLIAQSDHKYSIDLKTSAGSYGAKSNVIVLGQWSHLVGSYDGANLKLYQNGVLINSTPVAGTVAFNGYDLFFGRRGHSNAPIWFDGRLDEVGIWNRALSPGEVAQLYRDGLGITWDGTFESISTHPTLLHGLVGHYKLDANGNDDSVNVLHGTPFNTITHAAGKIDNAMVANAGAFQLPKGGGIFAGDYVGVSAWVYPTGRQNWMGAVSYFRTTGSVPNGNWLLGLDNSNPGKMRWLCGCVGSGDTYALDPVAITNDAWTHFSGSYDGTQVKLFRNSTLIAQAPGSGVLKKNDIYPFISSRDSEDTPGQPRGDEYWLGRVDEVLIHNRTIFPSEVIDLYNSGNGLVWEAIAIDPVTNFLGTPGPREIAMTWTNPGGSFAGVTLRRREDTYPTGPTDGTEVYRGALAAFTDQDLDPTKTYYYSIYAFDSVPNYSTGVSDDWIPLELPVVTDFAGVPGPRWIELSWTNPSFPEFDHVVVRGSYTTHPATPTDGDLVYSGTGESVTSYDRDAGVASYYSVFVLDSYGEYSDAVSDDWIPEALPATTDFAGDPGPRRVSLSWTNPVYDKFDNEFFLDVNDLSGAGWLFSEATYSTTPVLLRNGTIGTTHTFKENDTDDTQHNVGQVFSITNGISYCQYWELKYSGSSTNPREWVVLYMSDGVGLYGSWFNIRYGTLGSEAVYGITAGRDIELLGDGWVGVWVWIEAQQTLPGGGMAAIGPCESDYDDRILTETPGGQDSFYCANQQLVAGRNPRLTSFDKVMIRHSTVSYPVTPDDGTQIYWDSGESYEHLNLDPTLYQYYSIFAYDQYGAYADPQADRWMPEVLPPVTGFTAVTGTLPGQISLSWTNPVYDGFLKVVLRRSDVSYPVLPTDGDLAYQGTDEALLDGSLDPTKTYYYSIFAFDSYLVYSVRATASAVPHENYARMTNVSVTAPDTIRVTFDQQMTMGTGDGTDVLYLANWTMETLAHPANPQTVTMVQLSPTIVQIVLDSEGTVGADYTIRVADTVTDSDGHLINPSYREITFSGLGQKPQVSFARSYTNTSVLVQFDEAVLGADVYTNYSIPGLTLSAAELLDEGLHQYRVYTSPQVNAFPYTVTVTGVTDAIGNPIDTAHNSWEFLGVSTQPTVAAAPVSVSHTQVIIRFDMRVLHADEIVNYTIEPSLDVLSSEQYGDIYTYLLVTDPQIPSIPYTLTVAQAVTGVSGDPINPDHDTVSFYGQVNDPPTVDLVYPTTGAQDFPIRDMITVTAADAQRMKGIDEATWNITISRPLINGTTETLVPVVNGELQPNFMGEYSGDPDSPEGVTWRLVPKGWWPTGSLLIVNSSVQDKEGEPDNPVLTEIGSFETGVAIYIEDMQGLTRTDLDTQLLTPLKSSTLRNCEALRRQVIAKCSTKKDRTIQARTLLYWSSRTAVRSTILAVADFSSLGTMRFGDRSTVADFYTSMSSFLQIAQRAVEELRGQDSATRDLLRKMLKQSDPLQVVSAMAAIAILGTFEG